MQNALSLFSSPTREWFTAALGQPTQVQCEAWPAIAKGGHTLVSAPTGTGKTLSAFLVFIDRLKEDARAGRLKKELHLIYISPLKALAGDIRENLHRPLFGIPSGSPFQINVGVRTGDTPASERRKMIKNPPHILITTPESLYLLITSLSGQFKMRTAKAVIIDELHAMIDTKRGAHMMLSLARLDGLCGRPLQRIGLSATIDPLEDAAAYLTGDGSPVTIAAPPMKKDIRIEVAAPLEDMRDLPNGTIWPELARSVYEECYGARSVIAFVDGRMSAEKLAYQVNLLAGDSFARTHHGCVSKEQRHEAEEDLHSGKLRLLVATSSMELGIDVGDIDRVVQIAYPRSIASVLQRLGRAGHNPGRESVMRIFPRTVAEGLYCGLTADIASRGEIEKLHPPKLCLDVLAQHLVSMATGAGYSVDGALKTVRRAYPFRDINKEDIRGVLAMLAGDYEHDRDLPVRPRILYDRINEWVDGDAYSRMLAVSAGGTIPDTGQFTARTEGGVKIGDLDEEFVFEQRVGMKFMLGAFAWKIMAMDRDTVTVAPTNPEGADPPFWRSSWLSRKLQTGIAFGKRMRELTEAAETDKIIKVLMDMGLDDAMAKNTARTVEKQLEATGVLPDDRTIIIEHFSNDAGYVSKGMSAAGPRSGAESQLMIHSIFGRQVNAPLAVLLQQSAQSITGTDVSVFEDDDGILLMARSKRPLPERLLYTIMPAAAKGILEAVLPETPLFNMTFRYNTGRALMMGVRQGRRQPLWVQRLRSAEMLDAAVKYPDHPLIRETKRECLDDYWDLPGLIQVLEGIQSGAVQVRELHRLEPSPLSLQLRRAAEASFMYEYFPGTKGISQAAEDALADMMKIKPAAEQLALVSQRKKLPEDEKQLHSLLMTEGDLTAGELELPVEWFESLAAAGRVLYIEPGLWIAAEQAGLYERALTNANTEAENEARRTISRRALRYRGAMDAAQLSERYFWRTEEAAEILRGLAETGAAVEDGGQYFHADLYEYARRETVSARRRQVKTRPPQVYAALLAERLRVSAPPAEQLTAALESLNGRAFPPAVWESVILPARVNNYRAGLLDNLLASGGWFWKLSCENGTSLLSFHPSGEIDWDFDMASLIEDGGESVIEIPDGDEFKLSGSERKIFGILLRRGASFIASLEDGETDTAAVLMSLAEKGLAKADSFVPIRQWLDKSKTEKAAVKQKVRARVLAQTSGRWELCRPVVPLTMEKKLERAFSQTAVLCRETAAALELSWPLALEKLRVWEYTGQARRGYFVEGMSGAQFVHEKDYAGTMLAFETLDTGGGNTEELQEGSISAAGQLPAASADAFLAQRPANIVWLSAIDPLQPWGKLLSHPPDRAFMCVQGTAVALKNGLPAAVFEKNGGVLRLFEGNGEEILQEFIKAYTGKKIFPDRKRLTVKQYPPEAEGALQSAGFKRVMMDYVAYQS